MALQVPLARPPITEALVDIRATLAPSFSANAFDSVRALLKDDYPVVEEMRRFEASFEVHEGRALAAKHHDRGLVGMKFTSADGRQVAQFRSDGFTLNRLEPYTAWNRLLPEALRLWAMYAKIAKPPAVARAALRYINRIQLPPEGDLTEWLTVSPPLFPGAPTEISDYLLRLSTFEPGSGLVANVAQSLERAGGKPFSLLVLDIDTYRQGPFTTSDRELGPILTELRRAKNDIFFGMITDRMVASFND